MYKKYILFFHYTFLYLLFEHQRIGVIINTIRDKINIRIGNAAITEIIFIYFFELLLVLTYPSLKISAGLNDS